ncbi:MAG: HAD family phosphatase [Bacteroidaceae bacterium]|nr:HAD family phosphatase [Bacteroidaceae bacterium]
MKVRFLASDLDGTLLTTEKTITPYTQEVLIEEQKRGITIILASGRPLYSILPYAEQLELQRFGGFIISFNGSLVWDCAEGKAIKKQAIPLSLIPELVAAIGSEFRIHGYKGNNIVVQGKPDEHSLYISRANKMPLIETNDFAETITEPQHKCIVTGAPRKLWHLEKRLQKQFEADFSICRSESFLLEIMPKGIDKADALRELLERVGGETKELLCLGDGYNDLNMMRLAGVSCATQNAKKQVKQAATFVTKSNDRDGVALAVEKYVTL